MTRQPGESSMSTGPSCRAACSPPTATSSITAATRGTASSTSLGSSCPSASATGPMHDDQRGWYQHAFQHCGGAQKRYAVEDHTVRVGYLALFITDLGKEAERKGRRDRVRPREPFR